MSKSITWARQLRLHQWIKNLLVIVPAITSFHFGEGEIWPSLALAFLAMSLTASSVYIVNDVVDAPNDRKHRIKKNRPIASGQISVAAGLTVACLILGLGLWLALLAGTDFFTVLVCYLGLTFIYTFWLKRKILVDCITLGVLYTLRVVAGGAVTGITISFWLLAFSIFFFASLAWVKRYAELEALQGEPNQAANGRGYQVRDLPVVLAFGSVSAFIAVLIFALYLDSDAIKSLYRVPEIGWIAIPLIMYLIGRTWFKANRGEMNEDPILFALKDVPSLITAALIAASLAVAHLGF